MFKWFLLMFDLLFKSTSTTLETLILSLSNMKVLAMVLFYPLANCLPITMVLMFK